MKSDLKKQITSYTAHHGRFEVVTVPEMQFLMIDGHGDPNTSEEYRNALATIFPIAYKLKFLSKGELGRDYTVMPLEALWWSEDMDSFTTARDKSQWSWTTMNMIPDWITTDHVEAVRRTMARTAGAAALDALRMQTFDEGLVVQTLHIGSYDDEGPVLEAMHDRFIPDHSLRLTGRHHEIYLSDQRRTPADRLKTILRQPVAR
ncbi:MAG: GyrI-like domain-containing protein [Leifsonia sp.]